jgi:trehalose-phosphatase
METATGAERAEGEARPPQQAAPVPDPSLRRALEEFVRRDRILVALDFDGTLAPLVDDPDTAEPVPLAAEAIAALAGLPRTYVAVISGRPLEQLRQLIDHTEGVALVGSHGAEIDESDLVVDGDEPGAAGDDDLLDDAEAQLLAHVRDAVADVVAAHPGTTLEEKPAAVVLHTRRADREAAIGATSDVLQGPGSWPDVHVLRGKEVVELAVTDVTKGRALRRLRADLGLDGGGVFFAGDDTTDERAFAVLDDDGGDVSVKVGAGRTAARHRVGGPRDLAEILAFVARGRREPAGTPRPRAAEDQQGKL